MFYFWDEFLLPESGMHVTKTKRAILEISFKNDSKNEFSN
jgi:hypothetical protein